MRLNYGQGIISTTSSIEDLQRLLIATGFIAGKFKIWELKLTSLSLTSGF